VSEERVVGSASKLLQ